MRHGATAANLARLRCGGDLDLPLTDLGREQSAGSALDAAIAGAADRPDRHQRPAAHPRDGRASSPPTAARRPLELVIEPGFAERHLGDWNLLPIEETQAWLDARAWTPPGGESDDEFTQRVARARYAASSRCCPAAAAGGQQGRGAGDGRTDRPAERLELENGEVAEFDFTSRPCLQTTWSAL